MFGVGKNRCLDRGAQGREGQSRLRLIIVAFAFRFSFCLVEIRFVRYVREDSSTESLTGLGVSAVICITCSIVKLSESSTSTFSVSYSFSTRRICSFPAEWLICWIASFHSRSFLKAVSLCTYIQAGLSFRFIQDHWALRTLYEICPFGKPRSRR